MPSSHLRSWAVAVCLLTAMILAGVIGRRDRRAAVLLFLLAVVWIGVDQAWEGPVLLPVLHNHGLTASDLPGVAAAIVAVALFSSS